MNEDHVSALLRRLGKTVSAHPSVVPLVVQRLNERVGHRIPEGRASAWNSHVMPLKWAGIGLVAAGILIGFVIVSGVRSAIAFEQVQEALSKIGTVVATVEYPNQPHQNQRGFLSANHENARIEMGGLAVIMSPNGESLMLNMEENTAQRSSWNREGDESTPAEMLVRLTRVGSEAAVCDGKETIDGRQLIRFEIQGDADDPELSKKLRSVVWVDPKTRLPVRSETIARDPTDKVTGNKHWIISYQFNVPMPDSHFSLEPPRGYRLVANKDFRLPTSRLPKRPESVGQEKLVLIPKQGIGNVQFGMVQRQIEKELGPPDDVQWLRSHSPEEKAARAELRKNAVSEGWDKSRLMREAESLAEKFSDAPRDRWSLEYHGMGLRLNGSLDDGLTTIVCRSGKFGMYRRFPGRTIDGVSFDSTPADVHKVYGEPSRESGSPASEDKVVYMVFENRGVTIQFRDDKIFEIELQRADGDR